MIHDREEVVGIYDAHHAEGAEVLELDADGTYIDHFIGTDGSKADCSGRWRFDADGGEPKVDLEQFVQHFPESYRKGPIGTLLGAEKKSGQVRLYLSYDRNQFYSRRST